MAEQTITRADHIKWCKLRAIEYVEIGDYGQAMASMASDLGKHPETANHPGMVLGMAMLAGGHFRSKADARQFIEGFN